MDERDIIFGGEDVLKAAITHAGSFHPKVIFVLSSCAAETIGDDVSGVCAACPGSRICVIPTAGFLGGSFDDGFSKALVTLAEKARPEGDGTGSLTGVNLVGEKNLEYEVEQHYVEVSRLLGLLDIPVRIRFVRNIRTVDLGNIGSASLNILREPGLKRVGDAFSGMFGTPYIDSFPVGLTGTCLFLSELGEHLGIDYTNAIRVEREAQARMLKSFDDLAGCPVHIPEAFAKLPEWSFLEELVESLDLRPREGGPALPYVPPFPVGTTGIRRMMHRWRRVLHA